MTNNQCDIGKCPMCGAAVDVSHRLGLPLTRGHDKNADDPPTYRIRIGRVEVHRCTRQPDGHWT